MAWNLRAVDAPFAHAGELAALGTAVCWTATSPAFREHVAWPTVLGALVAVGGSALLFL